MQGMVWLISVFSSWLSDRVDRLESDRLMLIALWDSIWGLIEANEALAGWLGILSLFMFVGTLVVVPMIIVALPGDFLTRQERPVGYLMLRFWYYPYLIVKNVLGVGFICAGLAMLVLPGQGLLTIFIGACLLSFPRKRVFIRRILGQSRILQVINKLRLRCNKVPLDCPE